MQLHKIMSASGYDLKLLCTAFLLLAIVRLGLFVMPFRRLLQIQTLCIRRRRKRAKRFEKRVSLKKLIASINSATCYMPGGAKCLARALSAQLLLAGYGYFPTLELGVAKDEANALIAHAWLEIDNRIVLGQVADLDRYQQLCSLSKTI